MRNAKKLISEIKMLAADYLLLIALKLYPKGLERESLCLGLSFHFQQTLETAIDKRKEKQAELIIDEAGFLGKEKTD